jgi:carboxymethylenebutenolidase
MIITSEIVSIPTTLGSMRTEIFRPAVVGTFPAIIFFSEIFQITGPIRRAASVYAGHGFVVAVPEIFHEFEQPGSVLAYDQAGADRGNYLKKQKEVSSYDADTHALTEYLTSREDICTGSFGAVGVCIGGHLAFRAGMHPKIKATACFYATDIHSSTLGLGGNDDSLSKAGDIHGELLMIWGRQDPHVPDEGRALVYQRLVDCKRTFTWHEFNAQHAFMRDEGHRYDPALALRCYQEVTLFLNRILTRSGLINT